MSSCKLQAIISTQNKFINNLLDRLEGKSEKVEVPNSAMVIDINGEFYHIGYIKRLLNDPYFKGLNLEQIIELAKKSIRITAENCDLYHDMEQIKQICEKAEVGGMENILEIVKKHERVDT